MCSHLLVLKAGGVVASGPIGEIHEEFAGLETGFMHLTEQLDVDRVAENIVTAVCQK